MEATQITVSEWPLTMWVLPKFSSRLHRQTRLQTPAGHGAALPITLEEPVSPGTERTQVCAFRHLFCQATCRRLSLRLSFIVSRRLVV